MSTHNSGQPAIRMAKPTGSMTKKAAGTGGSSIFSPGSDKARSSAATPISGCTSASAPASTTPTPAAIRSLRRPCGKITRNRPSAQASHSHMPTSGTGRNSALCLAKSEIPHSTAVTQIHARERSDRSQARLVTNSSAVIVVSKVARWACQNGCGMQR